MSRKLKHSTLSKGWGLTSVCKNVIAVKESNSFTAVSPQNWRISLLLSAFMIASFFSTSSYGQCSLTCDDQKQISLSTTGYAVIIPQLVLNGDFSCAGEIVVTVYDENNQPIGDTVTCEHIGRTFNVEVISASTGLECSSTIRIEDKFAPQISCSDTMLICSASTLPADLGYPKVVDNCHHIDSSFLTYFDLYKELPCGSTQNGIAVGGRITRSWTAIDDSGNIGTCTQNIYLIKETVQNVVFPADRDDVDSPAVSCTNFDETRIELSGEPTINGMPIRNGDACKLFISYQDQTKEVCPPASYRLIRRWEVTDLCTQEVAVGIQYIFVVDNNAPVITCPDSFSLTSNFINCGATVILPLATATDSCSNVTVQPSWEFGTGYGPFNNVPVGTHTITYTATDECGNSAECTSQVTIVDNIQPIAVCRNELHIALSNDGIAEVEAAVFDGGSRDNCEIVKWEVTKDTTYGNTVLFTCDDVNKVVQVRLKVYDAAGLYSECGMNVTIIDEERPTIQCPEPIVLDCSNDASDLVLTGEATATDNCSIADIYYEDNRDVNSCNIGTIVRTWIALDSSGNRATCQQLIYLQDTTPITIVFPEDYVSNECGANITPDSTGMPIVSGADCENILISHTDEVFLIGDSACMKILRTWTVLDWCSYDPAQPQSNAKQEMVQLIKIIDEEAPIITDCPADITVGIIEFACETRVDLSDLVATDCNPNLTISNTSEYADANGSNASGIYPIGVHEVRFIVSDGCGNVTTCEMTITVEDRNPPTPICKYGLTIALMQEGFVIVPPNAINSASYDNCSGEEGLTYAIEPNYFTCDDIGRQEIRLIVTDAVGNSDFCTTEIFIQENNNVCDPNALTAIGGRIFTEEGKGMQEVPIQISGGKEAMGKTDAEGNYLFENLTRTETYSIRPMTNEDYKEGISTFDLVLIRKHILGIDALDSPYKILAADVNNSGTITTFDMVSIRQVILGTRTEFTDNTSWRYIDASYEFEDPRNPLGEPFPEFHDYKLLLINDLERDFIGIKIGDVNNSASPSAMAATGRNTNGTLNLEVADLELKAGFEYRIPVTGKDLNTIQGYQFTIDFDENSLQFKEVISGEPNTMGQNNFGFQQTEVGKLTTSWENAGVIRTNEETELFTLVFEAKAAIQLSNVLTINSEITLAEAYNQKDELMEVALQFSRTKLDKNLLLFQNYPNPFMDKTKIAFNLPKSTEGSISIHDINGKLLKSYYGKYAQGYNEIEIDLSEIHIKTGVLYYQLSTPLTKRLSKKMVLIRE